MNDRAIRHTVYGAQSRIDPPRDPNCPTARHLPLLASHLTAARLFQAQGPSLVRTQSRPGTQASISRRYVALPRMRPSLRAATLGGTETRRGPYTRPNSGHETVRGAARRGTCASALRRARRKGRLRCFALCQAQAMLPARVTAAAYRARQRVQPDAFGCHGCEGSPPAQLRLRQGVAGEEPSFCPCSERVSGGKRSSPAAPRRGLVTRCTTASRRRRV